MCLHCSFRSEYGGAQSCEKRHSHNQLQLLIKDGPERAAPPAFDGARAGRAGERTPLAVNHVRCLNRTGVVACALVCSRWASAVWQSQRRVAARRRPVRPRGSGFFGLDRLINATDPRNDYLHLWTFAPDGSGPSQNVGGFLCKATLQRTSAGGVLMNERCGSGLTVGSRIVWYDDAGTQKWSTFISGSSGSAPPEPNAAAGDAGGNVLITTASDNVGGRPAGDLLGRWIAPDGSLSGDWFVLVAGDATPPVLQSLIAGGVAVMQNGKWLAVVPPLGGLQPAPDWLTSRPDQDFRIVRGRKAYAFTSQITAPQPHGFSGGPLVEVVAPSGTSCGTFDTKGYAAAVGGDGSVIANTDDCTRRVWPGLLGVR